MVGRETAVSNGAMGIICSHPPRLTCLQLDLAASQSIELRMPLGCLFPPCCAPRARGGSEDAHIYNERCTTRGALQLYRTKYGCIYVICCQYD
jgi:hypothetical protein